MSHVADLISHRCPDGVEFIELQKLFITRNGYTPSRSKPDYWENGTIPWFRLADIRGGDRILTEAIENISPSAVKKSGLFPAGTIIISTLATIGEHALLEIPGLCNQQLTALTLREKYAALFNIKFLFYYTFVLADWCKKNTMNSNFASVDMKQFKRFKFPMPLLEVQDELVRILDSFTELEANLQTELKARSKQYEYYRDSLLSLENLTNRLGKENVKLLPLNDVCAKVSSGGTPKRSVPGYFGGSIPWIRSTDLNFKTIGAVEGNLTKSGLDNSSAKLIPTGTVLIAMAGATVAKCGITTVEATTNQNCCALEANLKQINPKFLFHTLCREYTILKDKAQGTQQFLNMTRIKQHEIPMPPLAEQERIVAILDKFDALVNDLSSGLPAEIAARRKQYEYYRDQLLTFTPAK